MTTVALILVMYLVLKIGFTALNGKMAFQISRMMQRTSLCIGTAIVSAFAF